MIDLNGLGAALADGEGRAGFNFFSIAKNLARMINARLAHEQVVIKADNMLNRGRKTCEENKFFDRNEQPDGCQQCYQCAKKSLRLYEAYRYELDEAVSCYAEDNALNEIAHQTTIRCQPCVTCHRLSKSTTEGMCLDCWRDHNGDNEFHQKD